MTDGRDVWWHDLVPEQSAECPPEPMDSRGPALPPLHSAAPRRKPKGIMHTTGGYLTQVAWTHKNVFDLQPDTDVYWCAADVGWVTGHSYIVYGPLANRTTSVHVRGHARPPRQGPALVDRREVRRDHPLHRAHRDPHVHEVGHRVPRGHDLSSLRLLGTVGEPINPEAWVWYWQHIGGGRCPVVDTWWQTETGAIMISPLPGATTLKPGSATFPLPGIGADIVDDDGQPGADPRRRLPRAHPAVAVDAARASGATRSATATRTGRRSTAGTSRATAPSATTRLLLAARPRRRRDARRRPQHLDHRGRARAGRAPRGRRGRGRRHARTPPPARPSPRS